MAILGEGGGTVGGYVPPKSATRMAKTEPKPEERRRGPAAEPGRPSSWERGAPAGSTNALTPKPEPKPEPWKPTGPPAARPFGYSAPAAGYVNPFEAGTTFNPGPQKVEPEAPVWHRATDATGFEFGNPQAFTATGPYQAPPTPEGSVLEALNASGWKLPDPKKKVSVTSDMFKPEDVQKLAPFSYEMAPQEWQLIQDTYSSPAAKDWGYAAPAPVSPSSAKVVYPTITSEDTQSAAMTWEAYNALPQDQKDAVDFNTLLIASRQKDLTTKQKPTAEQKTKYDQKVHEMFGSQGGSEAYAPNTVELLGKLDFKAVGQDLDEFLSLEAGVTTEELKDFKLSKDAVKMIPGLISKNAVNPGTPYAEVRSGENKQAAISTAITKAKQLLTAAAANPATAAFDFNTLASTITPTIGATEEKPVGYGDSDADILMRTYYSQLMNPATADMNVVWEDMAVRQFTDADKQMFFDYVDDRTRMEGQYGSPPIAAGQGTPRDPKSIRAMVGLGD